MTLSHLGGATSVGSNAIQLAAAVGYEVITTASPRNSNYVKKLGASQVFDHNDKTVVEDIIEAFKGKTIAGALTIGTGSFSDPFDHCQWSCWPAGYQRWGGGVSAVADCAGARSLPMCLYRCR